MFFFKVDFDKAYDEDEVSTKVEVLDPWMFIYDYGVIFGEWQCNKWIQYG